MKLWFMNGLFFESDDKSEIVTTLNTQFQKHNMLREAGSYKTAELIVVQNLRALDVSLFDFCEHWFQPSLSGNTAYCGKKRQDGHQRL